MITFPGNILKAEGTQLRLYTLLDPLWTLENGTTPYIKHTETPRITWIANGSEGIPLVFGVLLVWVSITGQIETVLDTGFSIYNLFYNLAVYERLTHVKARDSGGYYRLILSAKEGDIDQQSIGGAFKVNYVPTRPTNLTVI